MICGRKQIQRLSALLVMMLVTGAAAVAAQAVDGDPIQLMDTQFGRLSTDTPDMMYSVEVYAEQVFSVRAWPISGDLQLEVTVSDPAGDVVAESVLAYEKGGTVVAEAILAPTDGMYSILVQRVGETSGDFGVVALPGFGELSIQDRFDNDGLFQLAWPSYPYGEYWTGLVAGEYLIQLNEADRSVFIQPEDGLAWGDFYAEISGRMEENTESYYLGLIVRYQREGDSARFYAVFLTSTGTAKILLFDQGVWTVLAEESSPVIDLNSASTTVGVLMVGNTFKVYCNGQIVGETTDPNETISEGEIGLMVETTADEPGVPLEIYYDDLVITTPLTVGKAAVE